MSGTILKSTTTAIYVQPVHEISPDIAVHCCPQSHFLAHLGHIETAFHECPRCYDWRSAVSSFEVLPLNSAFHANTTPVPHNHSGSDSGGGNRAAGCSPQTCSS